MKRKVGRYFLMVSGRCFLIRSVLAGGHTASAETSLPLLAPQFENKIKLNS